jgi:hypothetical protein
VASTFITGVAASRKTSPVIKVFPIFLAGATLISGTSVCLAAHISGAYSWENAVATSDGVAPE